MVDNRNNCPKCDSQDISVYEGEMFDGAYQEKVECHDCSYQWENVYELTARYIKHGRRRLDTYKTVCDKDWAHD